MLSTLARRPPVAGRCSAEALEAVLRGVMSQGYHFVTPTPLTHARVLARAPGRRARNLRDVFGWSMPFDAQLLAPGLLAAMKDGQVLYAQGDALHSAVRVSSLGQDALLHSAYPTVQDDAVFFGPDTYRFARFIEQAVDARVAQAPPGGEPGVRVLDIGCGSGAGGIVAARRLAYHGKQPVVTMNDINPQAVRLAAVNAAVAGVPVRLAPGDALAAVEGDFDLIISNPPYMADAGHRAYRDGGAGLGRELSVRIARESLARLTPNGQLLLYTGVAIVDGKDPFLAEVEPLLRAAGCQWSYSELDADVFGEELEAAPYDQAERIAAVGLVATHTGQA